MFVLRFTAEKGQPVQRPLYAKVVYRKVSPWGPRTKTRMLHETPETATQWATREGAERTAAEFSKYPDLYKFAVEEVTL